MRLLKTSTANKKALKTTNFVALGTKRSLNVLRVRLTAHFVRASNFIRFQSLLKIFKEWLSVRLVLRAYLDGYKGTAKCGFTLLEMLVVMGILSMLGGLGLFANFDTYHGYMFRGERDNLVAALEKARSQSINNICLGTGCSDGKSHGVYIEKGKYVIFQGASYSARDTAIDETIYAQYDDITLSVVSAEIVFAQLSGDVLLPLEIGMQSGDGHTSTTSINTEGRISWTN